MNKTNKVIKSLIAKFNPLKFFKGLVFLLKKLGLYLQIGIDEINSFFQYSIDFNRGISVIIPTYEENDHFYECINSVLKQNISKNKIEIIVSINAGKKDYYNKLKRKYSTYVNVKVVYSEGIGLSAARNFAVGKVSKKYFTFLDDDDYFTSGYLKSLIRHFDKDVNIVFGRLVDMDSNGFNKETYINKELAKAKRRKTKDYFSVSSLFTPAWAKAFRTRFYINNFSGFDENVKNGEDIMFWADNFDKMSGYIYCCRADGKQALIRRVVQGSMSRPIKEDEFSFYVNDRLKIIGYIEKRLFQKHLTILQRRFLLNKINAQYRLLFNYYESVDKDKKKIVRDIVSMSESFYINKSKLSDAVGVVFCDGFPPCADGDSYNIPLRIEMINGFENVNFRWMVFSNITESNSKVDHNYSMFYASQVIDSNAVFDAKDFPSCSFREGYVLAGDEFRSNMECKVIYSSSGFLPAHICAKKCREENINSKWYAEVSLLEFERNLDRNAQYGRMFDYIQMIIKGADVLIFSDKDDFEQLLSNKDYSDYIELIKHKSIKIGKAKLDKKFDNILVVPY